MQSLHLLLVAISGVYLSQILSRLPMALRMPLLAIPGPARTGILPQIQPRKKPTGKPVGLSPSILPLIGLQTNLVPFFPSGAQIIAEISPSKATVLVAGQEVVVNQLPQVSVSPRDLAPTRLVLKPVAPTVALVSPTLTLSPHPVTTPVTEKVPEENRAAPIPTLATLVIQTPLRSAQLLPLQPQLLPLPAQPLPLPAQPLPLPAQPLPLPAQPLPLPAQPLPVQPLPAQSLPLQPQLPPLPVQSLPLPAQSLPVQPLPAQPLPLPAQPLPLQPQLLPAQSLPAQPQPDLLRGFTLPTLDGTTVEVAPVATSTLIATTIPTLVQEPILALAPLVSSQDQDQDSDSDSELDLLSDSDIDGEDTDDELDDILGM